MNLVLYRIEGTDKLAGINIKESLSPIQELARLLGKHSDRKWIVLYRKTFFDGIVPYNHSRIPRAIIESVVPPAS